MCYFLIPDNTPTDLHAAGFAAFGWDASMSDDEMLEKLFALNLNLGS